MELAKFTKTFSHPSSKVYNGQKTQILPPFSTPVAFDRIVTSKRSNLSETYTFILTQTFRPPLPQFLQEVKYVEMWLNFG